MKSYIKNCPVVLEFHNVTDKKVFGITNIKKKKFLEILKLLKDNFNILEPHEITAKKSGIIISFDDGFKEIYTEVFPLFKEINIKAIVSIITGYIGKKNAWDLFGGNLQHMEEKELCELDKHKWLIVSHGMYHKDLTRLDDKSLEFELKKSKDVLEHLLHHKVEGIAYPFGRFNKRVVYMAKKVGYKFGLAAASKIQDGIPEEMKIYRIPIYSIDPLFIIKRKIEEGIWKKIDHLKNVLMNKIALFTIFFKMRKGL